MGHVILIWRLFNTSSLFILYELQVLSSSQHYDIIPSGVILNLNILYKCIALNINGNQLITTMAVLADIKADMILKIKLKLDTCL